MRTRMRQSSRNPMTVPKGDTNAISPPRVTRRLLRRDREPLSAPGSGRFRRDGDRSLTVWTTGLLLGGVLPQYLVASLAVAVREDMPLSSTELGAAAGISFAVSAIVSPLAGRALERLGLTRGVLLATVLIASGSFGMAAFANSATAVIAFMGLNGLGTGIGSPTLSALLASGVRPARQGTAFGLLTAAPQMAAFGAGLALPLVAEPFSWRLAFVGAGMVSVTCLAGLAWSGRLRAAPPGRPEGEPVRGFRAIHVVAIAASLASAAGIGMRSFLVVFAVTVGFSSTEAGLLMSGGGLIALGSRLGFGMLQDHRPGDPLVRAAALMLVCAIGFGMMALPGKGFVLVGALLGGGLGWGWQSPLSLAVISQNPRATGAAIGIQMSGFFLGALVGPLVVGLLAEHDNYTAAWAMCSGLAVAAAAVTMAARRLPLAT